MARRVTRRHLLAAGAAVLGSIAGCQELAAGGTDAWPLRRRDARRSGHNPNTAGPAVGRTLWSAETGGRAFAPLVIDGAIYVGSGAIHALGASDGNRRWRRALGFDAATAPALHDGSLYVASRATLYALDSATGEDRWTVPHPNWWYHTPVVDGSTLYLGATKTRYSVDFEARVLALATDTGERRWLAEVGSNVVPPFVTAVADGRLFVGRNRMQAYDAGDGTRLWTFDAPEVATYRNPVVVDDTVYVVGVQPADGVDRGVLYALDAADGTERWRAESRLVPKSPAVGDGTVYLAGDRVYALDAVDGSERWRVETDRFVTAPPAVTDERIYLGGINGVVRALDAETGASVWRVDTGSPLLSAPAVVGDAVYVTGADGRVFALGDSA